MNSHCHNCEATATHNVELEQDNAALRKVLGECREAIANTIRNSHDIIAKKYLSAYLTLIEQTLSKGKTE